MAERAEEFWNALHERWRSDEPDREAAVVGSVLWHLAHRLSAPEARHVEAELPAGLRGLWPAPSGPDERVRAMRRVQKLDFDDFLMRVAEEANLPDGAETAAATRAVLHALGRVLSDEERMHLSKQLQPDYRAVWNEETA